MHNKSISKIDCTETKTNINGKVIEIENNLPDTTGLVTKTNFNTKLQDIVNKISNTRNLVTKANVNKKVTKIEYKIPGVANFMEKYRQKHIYSCNKFSS